MKRFTSIMLILIILIPVGVFADNFDISINAQIIRTTVDSDIIQEMIVWGQTSKELQGKKIGLSIVRPNVDIESDIEEFDKYAALYQGYIKDDGSYEFRFLFSEDKGDYLIRIKADTCTEVYSKTIYVSAFENIRNLIGDLKNKVITSQELLYLINNDNKDLGIDVTVFQNLSDPVKVLICDNLINKLENFTIDGFVNFFDMSTIFLGLTKSNDVYLKKQILNYYETNYIKLTENSLYDHFEKLNPTRQNEVIQGFNNKDLKSITELTACFYDNLFLNELYNISLHTQMGALINDYKDYLIISESVDKIVALSDRKKRTIYAYIVTKSNEIDSTDEFINLLNYAILNVDKLSNDNNKETGSNGNVGRTISIDPEISNVITPTAIEDDSFIDIEDISWARESILYLYEKGIVSGKERKKFYPNDYITRPEFIKIITEVFGYVEDNATCNYTDVSNDYWGYKYIASASSKGLVKGLSEGVFGIEEPITRQDMSTLIYRYLNHTGKNFNITTIKNSFADFDTISDYAQNSVLILSKLNIINGFEDNTFRPKEKATRAETAVLIYNIINIIYERK